MGRADWTLVFAPIFSKVTPAGEEAGLVEEGRGWQTGLGLHLKKVQSISCASFHLSFGRVNTLMIGAPNSSTPIVLGVTNFKV
jgi:hypothetical protein